MRNARILSVALTQPSRDDPADGVARNLENMEWALERAADYDPDFVNFPELALVLQARRGDDVDLADVAQPVPGEATDRLGEHARDLESYVWVPLYERDGERIYNTAALLDPDGELAGTYRKVGTTVGSADSELFPGSEVPVWDTPFGRVGCSICWDVRYPEIAMTLGAKNCDLMFHPTLGSGHEQLRTWALYQGFHVVATHRNWGLAYTQHGARRGAIEAAWRNPSFEPPTGGTARFSFVELNTDCKAFARASAGPETLESIQRTHPGAVEINAANEDGIIVIESRSDELTVEQVAEEFGLRTIREQEDQARDEIHGMIDDSPLLDFSEP